jgi:hypothetical protein
MPSLSRTPHRAPERPMRDASQWEKPDRRPAPLFKPTVVPEIPSHVLLTLRLQVGYALIPSLTPIQRRVEVSQLSRVASPELLDHLLARLDYLEAQHTPF